LNLGAKWISISQQVKSDPKRSLFGKERGDSLEGILGALEQTFGGQALYPR